MVRQLVPWNSAGGQFVDAFVREMEGLASRLQDESAGSDELASFAPRTNVAETESAYELAIELPGMQPEDFNIEFHEGRLSVTGERERETKTEGKTYHRLERQYGKFRRTFTLGQDVDPTGVSAEYKNGILHVMVPKSERAKPTKIPVKS